MPESSPEKRAVCPACGDGTLLVEATITVPLLDVNEVPACQAKSDAVVRPGAQALCNQCEWTGPVADVPMVNPHSGPGQALTTVRAMASDIFQMEDKLTALLKPLSDSDRRMVSKPLRYALSQCESLLATICKDNIAGRGEG